METLKELVAGVFAVAIGAVMMAAMMLMAIIPYAIVVAAGIWIFVNVFN